MHAIGRERVGVPDTDEPVGPPPHGLGDHIDGDQWSGRTQGPVDPGRVHFLDQCVQREAAPDPTPAAVLVDQGEVAGRHSGHDLRGPRLDPRIDDCLAVAHGYAND